MGPSGSGKSTLLHCLAGIFTPDSGEIWFDGQRLDQLSEARRTELRRTAFGFVFQFGQLVPELTAADNVALPLLLNRVRGARRRTSRPRRWLARLGLEGMDGRRTGELSGGEAQRVAVARALAIGPQVLFADEPTGSLDSLTGEKVMDLLVGLAREEGTTVVLVTHDARVAAYADREVMVRDGRVTTLEPSGTRRGLPLMIRLGLRLTLRSGREALVRLLVTAVAVAVGVARAARRARRVPRLPGRRQPVLLGVHAGHARCRTALPAARGELWNYSEDFYQGQTIERLDVAALGPGAPVPPGVSRLPGPGQYYASPALAALLRTVPARRAGRPLPRHAGRHDRPAGADRPGRAGHLRRATTPAALAALPGTQLVTTIATAPGRQVVHPVLPVRVRRRRARGAVPDADPDRHRHPAGGRPARGAVRRAAAGRRRRRGEISVIASVDAVVSALLGAIARHRPVPRGAARAGRRRAHRHPVLRRHGDPAPPGATSAVLVARAGRVGDRGAAVAAPGADLAARRQPAGHPAAAAAWRLATLVRRRRRCSCAGCSRPRTKPIGPPTYPGPADRHDRAGRRRPLAHRAAARLVRAGPQRGLAAAGRAAARGQPEGRVPGGARAGARRLPRHDRRRAGPGRRTISATANAAALSNVLLDTFDTPSRPAWAPFWLHAARVAADRIGCAATDVRPRRRRARYPAGRREAGQRPGGHRRDGGLPALLPAAGGRARTSRASTLGVVSCSGAARRSRVLGQCAPGLQAVQVQRPGPALQRQPAQQHRAVRRREQSRLHREPGRAAAAGGPGPGEQRGHAGAGPHATSPCTRRRRYRPARGRPPTPPRTYGEAVAIRSGRAACPAAAGLPRASR